jgi:hypothetical protein
MNYNVVWTCIKYEVELIWAGLITGILDSNVKLRINDKLMLCRYEFWFSSGFKIRKMPRLGVVWMRISVFRKPQNPRNAMTM